MTTLTKVFIYTVLIFILFVLFFVLDKMTHYDQRMAQYNKYMCANYGYQEDCKTPLSASERLK